MRGRIAKIASGIVIGLVVIYLLLVFTSPAVPDHPFFEGDVLVIAHQGGEGLRPSNTMSSFSNAVELGVDVLEMDIHSTADGVIVVMHDDTVDRTTDGSGRIQEMTLAEIKELDAGHYWSDDDGQSFPFRGQGITVPALEEVLDAFAPMRMNIEIKQESPSIVEPFCRMLEEHDMLDKVLVASFHPATIQEFRSQCPGVVTSMVEPEIRVLYGLHLAYLDAIFRPPAEAVQVPEYSGDLHVITRRFVNAAHRRNIDFHAWTINEEEDMRRILDQGVDGIITDRPDLLLKVLGR